MTHIHLVGEENNINFFRIKVLNDYISDLFQKFII